MNIAHRRRIRPGKSRIPLVLTGLTTVILLIAVLWGCLGGGRTTPLPFQYTLEYPSPRPADLTPLGVVLKVERFASAQGINNVSMIYRPRPYRYDAYPYHYWRVRPRDLVTDFLLRDLKHSGLFKAVLSYQDAQDARFVVQGAVTECSARYEAQDVQRAVLSLDLTLLDVSEKEITKQVVFGKRYEAAAAMANRSPEALAQGISASMEILAPEILRDILRAIRERPGVSPIPAVTDRSGSR